MTSPAAGVVFDHTALSLLGRGHRLLSGLVAAPLHSVPDRHVYVPALCLVAAVAERPLIGEHVLALPAIEVVGMGPTHALAVGLLLAQQTPWEFGHAIAVCRPDPEWPTGRPIITAEPKRYVGHHIDVIAVE
ncbi:hypothetical protein GCM10009682_56570 [Luedemannella flava]|uniref:Uncharacterized protein n=1 Tax=Luedemannella flava TaxID=349316 RepID=A0ABN2ML94_9ACTN